MSYSRIEVALRAQAQLGECPRWDEREHVLYWVDILAQALHRFDPATGKDDVMLLPEHIGCFSLAEDEGFIAGMRSGIWTLDRHGAPQRCIARNPENLASSRFNDGRCDHAGRFVVGTVDETRSASHATLYRLQQEGLVPINGGMLTSNGVAFSPDGRWLYHADTPNFVIFRRPYDQRTGVFGAREEWVKVAHDAVNRGRPDGAAVDVEGYYWSAFYEGGRVVRFAPDGRIAAEIPLPVRCPTMCAFGGEDLQTLYITSAGGGAQARLDEPLAGSIFALRTDVPGMIEARWRRASIVE